uniref:Uncharacterized protein n=1 Tax=Ciona savignyi TaxID=51511 RepID=H2YS91_CIOSA
VSTGFVVLTVFLALYYWYRRPKNYPPGPRGIPFLGVLPFLGNYAERTMHKWSKKYGPVMSVRMGRQDWVFLGDHETIRQALVNQGNSFSGRPLIATLDQITEGHGIVLLDYGDWWKRQRSFGFSTLRGFGVGKRSMEDRITEEVAYLNDAIRSHDGKAFDIKNDFGRILVFGKIKQFGHFDYNSNRTFSQLNLINVLTQSILSNAVSNNISSIVMGRRFEYDDEHSKEIMARLAMCHDKKNIFRVTARNNRRTQSLHTTKTTTENFIDAFLGEQNAENGTDAFTDKQLLHYVRDLFFAGSETSTSLRWTLLCLIHHPEQEKLRKEIFEVLGQEKIPAVDNKAYMPYTCAFMQEVYRYRTLAPFGVAHMTNEDVNLNGYSIPNGTTIYVNLWAVHNNPDVWDEPNKFKPERHLDDKGNFVQSNHVIPFSVGPRHCLGEQLARMEIFIYLVSLVQKFEFLPDPDATELPDIE